MCRERLNRQGDVSEPCLEGSSTISQSGLLMQHDLPLRSNIELVSDIVSAYVANNSLPAGDLVSIIHLVHAAIEKAAGVNDADGASTSPAAEPAVAIKKSITPDHLVCLDDGKTFKSLKRHLRQLGMTPDEYRAKWKLPPDYPMVAPNYAARRSALAKSMQLGQKAKPRD